MKIGVTGGGQLGRMLICKTAGMSFAFPNSVPDVCAQARWVSIRADYGDQDHLRQSISGSGDLRVRELPG
jgi:phosphoribosylaminoimidazole carboxylase (NCAIR synthetase)